MIATNRAIAETFANGVVSGDIPAGRLVQCAVKRHLLDLEEAGKRGLWFDEKAASGACDFFPLLKHSTGEYAGEPFQLRQWQTFVVWVLFGWKRHDGWRRFRDAMISVGRGNGKSPLGAAIGLQLFALDQPIENRAEVYAFATKRDQAKIVFDEAKRMVESSSLSRLISVMQTNMHIPSNHSKFEPLGSDSKNTDGLVIHGVIRDELHEWREKHRGLYDKIETAMGKRRQPMAISITTAGDDNSDLWIEQYEYSSSVVEQVLNPPNEPGEWFGDDHFGFVCEVDKDDDIYDPKNWPKANPMLLEPQSPVKIEHLQSMADKARAGDIVSEHRFRRYHCNQMVSAVEKPFKTELWKLGSGELTVEDGALAFGAFDLARSDDFAAITLCHPIGEDDDKHYEFQTWAFTCEQRARDLHSAEVLSLLHSDRVEVHSGNQIDFTKIRQRCKALHEQYQVQRWAYDPAFARDTAQYLQEDYGLECHEFAQNAYRYNEPILAFIKALREQRLRHGNCPVLRWQSGNLLLKKNAQGLVMPDKQLSKNKIDSMVAAFMSLAEAMFAERESGYWNTEDGIIL